MAGRKHLIESFVHYLTGGIVLLKAYDKTEHFRDHPFITIFLFVLGAAIVIATIFHRFLDRHVKEFRTLLHAFEFLVLILISYYYFSEGKKALPSVYLLAATGHAIAAVFFYRKKIKQIKKASGD